MGYEMKLCIALDMPSAKENLELLELLGKNFAQKEIWVKVGLRSFIRDGVGFLEKIKKINPYYQIFLDLKLYDIPNTMGDAMSEIAKLQVDMVTLHSSSGREAMNEVAKRLKNLTNPPLIMAVTALTSFDKKGFNEIYNANLESKVQDFAQIAYECGMNGVVCSVWESKAIKEMLSDEFLTLTPAIRPFWEKSDDQKRTANLQEAKEAQSDFIVVGRPIYAAENPKAVFQKILENL